MSRSTGGYTHTEINQQLVKNKRIQIKLVDFSFEVFNVDGTKNGKVTRMAALEVKINRHKKCIKVAVTDLNRMDMFLGHDWLVKHNSKVNWKEDKIQFTRCLESCRTKHQDIELRTRQAQEMNNQDNRQQEIGKKLDPMNSEGLPEYIQPFTYLFNKKKFEKLLE